MKVDPEIDFEQALLEWESFDSEREAVKKSDAIGFAEFWQARQLIDEKERLFFLRLSLTRLQLVRILYDLGMTDQFGIRLADRQAPSSS